MRASGGTNFGFAWVEQPMCTQVIYCWSGTPSPRVHDNLYFTHAFKAFVGTIQGPATDEYDTQTNAGGAR